MVVALELVERFLLVGPDHVGDVLRCMKIAHPGAWMLLQNVVADRVDQVRLTQAHSAVDEKRVIRRARMFGDLERRSAGELIGLARDETIEAEFRYQARTIRV